MFSPKKKGKKLVTVRTDLYRGHLIKLNSDDSNKWSVVIGDNVGVGQINDIRMTIDYWIDFGLYASPDYFKNKGTESQVRQVFDYKNFKLVNDLGGKNDWYVSYRGKLMKGSKEKIIEVIDRVELKRTEKN